MHKPILSVLMWLKILNLKTILTKLNFDVLRYSSGTKNERFVDSSQRVNNIVIRVVKTPGRGEF